MQSHHLKTLKPDIKGRVYLGELAKNVSSFKVTVDSEQKIILEPFVEIPAREKWLFDNEVALQKVKQGLKELAEGKLIEQGDFSQYLDDELDD